MDSTLGNIFPSELWGVFSYEEGFQNHGFCWRWKHLGHDQHRILTIEPEQNGQSQNRAIFAKQFFPYEQGIQGNPFSKHYMQVNNGMSYWILGISHEYHQITQPALFEVEPKQLLWTASAETNGEEFQFGLVNTQVDGKKLSLVALQTYSNINPSGIQPSALFDEQYKSVVENKSFCWRWVKRQDEDHRALTIEGSNIPDMPSPQVQSYELGLPNGLLKPMSFQTTHGYSYIIVVIETDDDESQNQQEISPGQLRWLDLTLEDCSQYKFTVVNGIIAGKGIVCLIEL